MKLLHTLLEQLTPYGAHAYFAIVGLLLACGFGLPMPEDIILVTAGVLSSHGIINFSWTVFWSMFGVLVGDGTIFCLGKFYGPKLKAKRPFSWILSSDRDQKVKSIFKKYGDKVIFMARFMPGLRTPIFFATGTYQIPFWKFLVFDGVAALISVPLWVYVGFLFGKNLETLEVAIKNVQSGMLVTGLCVVLLIVAIYFIKRRKK